MVKKFEEYINEDYFSKLANRKDNGTVRKENEMGFVEVVTSKGILCVADKDFEYDGRDAFDYSEIEELKDKFPKGCRLPSWDDIIPLKRVHKDRDVEINGYYVTICGIEFGPMDEGYRTNDERHYWCDLTNEDVAHMAQSRMFAEQMTKTARGFNIRSNTYGSSHGFIDIENFDRLSKCHIRLVKDKYKL